MTISDQLLAAFPKNINKAGEVFSTIVANGKDGAIETVLGDAKSYINEYVSTPDVYKQTDKQLEKTVNYFSFLERFDNESEKSLKQRFGAIFRRSDDTVWGNPHNVRNVFREYFPSATIYLQEGTSDITESILEDGDFEENLGWDCSDGADITDSDSFSKTFCLRLPDGGKASQQVYLDREKTYSLHFFLKNKTGVSIKDQDGRYWNEKGWQTEEHIITFACRNKEEWENKHLFFITDGTAKDVTLAFHGVENEAYIDYVHLYEKKNYHSFTVIAHFVSGATSGDLALAPGANDDEPIEQDKYDEYGYYSGAYMTGVKTGYALDLYRDLLEYVKSSGVKAYLNVCNQDYKGNIEGEVTA